MKYHNTFSSFRLPTNADEDEDIQQSRSVHLQIYSDQVICWFTKEETKEVMHKTEEHDVSRQLNN